MAKTRVLLGIVIVLSALSFIISMHYVTTQNSVIGYVAWATLMLSPLTLISGLFMLIFSFFRVHQTPDGRLAYNPNNFYWKCLSKFYSSGWKDNISLCEAFWKTVMFVGSNIIVAVALLMFSMLAYLLITEGWPKNVHFDPKQIAFFISLALTILGVAIAGGDGYKSKFRNYTGLAFIAFGLVVVPIYMAGILLYLKFALAFIGIMGAFLGAMYLFMWLISRVASSDSLLTKFFKALKDNYCPILVADTPEQENS